MDNNIKREIILDHYNNPLNKGLLKSEKYIKINSHSDSCIDNIDLEILIDNGRISDIRFDGEACAITTSATSIMIKVFMDKTIDVALNIIDNYERMINENNYDKKLLDELNVYEDIYKQPNRKRCALLPIEALKKVLVRIKENQ